MALLDSSLRLTLLLGGLLGLYLVRKISLYHKLKHFPGPRWTGITNIPHRIALFGWNIDQYYAWVSETYGPIARVAPGIIITSDPDVWAHVNRQPGYKRSDWYYHAARVEYRRDNVFTQTDNDLHDFRRKQMVAGYSGKENLDLEPAIDTHVQNFLHLIRTTYLSTDTQIIPMDLARKIQFFTLDVISGVGLGKSFGMLPSNTDVGDYARSTEEGLAISSRALALGLIGIKNLPWIGAFISPAPGDRDGFGRMMATCFGYVDERIASSTEDRSDMLASFIRHGLHGDELKSEAIEQVFAGSDTTAGSIKGILLLLMSDRRVFDKLRREIDDAVREGKVPFSSDEAIISGRQARQLPYLQAVIREGMRVLPSVANIFSRDLPPDGDEVDVNGEKVYIPGGVCIGQSALAMHRRKDIYGEDAGSFRPERWFEKDEEKLATMTRVNDLLFGAGRWMCLGKPVAQLELPKIVFEFTRNFDMAIINPANPWYSRSMLGLRMIKDMWVQVRQRPTATV